MKKFTLILLSLWILSIGAIGQIAQKNVETLFKDMYQKELKVLKEQKFTKAEVASIDQAMKNTGNKILTAVKASPGEPHQYLIDQVKKEFKALNVQLGKSLSGDKLTSVKNILTQTQNKLVTQLQNNYVGGQKGIRAGIRSNIRVGIRTTLLKGFGGQDLGHY